MAKFAKKESTGSITKDGPIPAKKGDGHLVINLDGKKPKMAVSGSGTSKVSEQKLLKKSGLSAKPAKGGKAAKPAKGGKAKAERVDVRGERNSAYNEQRIKVLQKDHGAREGSARAAKWDALVSSKTIAEAKDKEPTLNSGSITKAVQAGVIELY